MLDVAPVLPAARARPSRSTARVVAERGWVDLALLARLTGDAPYDGPAVGRWAVSPAALAEAEAHVRGAVEAAGPVGLDLAAVDARRRAVAQRLDSVVVAGGGDGRLPRRHPLDEPPLSRGLGGVPVRPAAPRGRESARGA
ncbi:MAG: hypothetical protein KY443_12120 [Actinobacteria bacterium]|nr:hypothetical protein [Actinomycetota bacterium]